MPGWMGKQGFSMVVRRRFVWIASMESAGATGLRRRSGRCAFHGGAAAGEYGGFRSRLKYRYFLGGWGKHDLCKATAIVDAGTIAASGWQRTVGHGGACRLHLSRYGRSGTARDESATAGDTDRP